MTKVHTVGLYPALRPVYEAYTSIPPSSVFHLAFSYLFTYFSSVFSNCKFLEDRVGVLFILQGTKHSG